MSTKQRRTKGDGALFKRPDGVWIGRVELPSLDGKRRHKTVSSRDRNVCIRRLKKLRADVDEGRIAVTANTTVGKWLTRWLEEIHGPKLRPTTLRDYRATVENHIIPNVGKKRLSALTPEHVRAMHRAIPSDRAAQKAHVVLQRALTDAVKEGMLARNVATIADAPRYKAKQRKPLTTDQANKLLRVAAMLDDPMATRWAAALYLGARQGEVLGLQWDQVDLANGTVDLAWQLQQLQQVHGCGAPQGETYPCGRKRVGFCPDRRWDLPRGFEYQILHRSLALTKPKTAAGERTVPLPAPLWAVLEQHPRGDNNPHDLVWHHDDGRPIGPRDDYTNWQAALTAAGLPAAPLHIARNTTATLLLEAGVDAKIIQDILGHSSVIVTRGYQYADQTLKRREMDRAFEQLAIGSTGEPGTVLSQTT